MKRKHLAVLILLLFVVACAGAGTSTQPQAKDSPQTLAWKTLMTNKQIYDTTFQTLSMLDKQGKLPKTTKAQAIQLGNVYLVAHNQAVQALLENRMPDMNVVKAALDKYIELAGPYATGVK